MVWSEISRFVFFLSFLGIALSCGTGVKSDKTAAPGVSGASSTENPDGSVTVTITGSGFLEGVTVVVNGSDCTDVHILSSTQLTCILPNGNIQLVNIVVIPPGGGGSTPISVSMYARAVTVDTSTGTVGWNSPTSVTGASDGVYSSYGGAMGTVTSHYLKASDFGFSIPSSATINGIAAEILTNAHTASEIPGEPYGNETTVKIVNSSGNIGGSSQMNLSLGRTFITDTPTTFTYGGSSSLLGESWTPADINQSNFGIAFSCTKAGVSSSLKVDSFKITISYTR